MRDRVHHAARRLGHVPALLAAVLVWGGPAAGASPRAVYTTHFFDWYRVTKEQPYETHQRVWTFRPLWERYGIGTGEVGNTERYYAVQMRMMRQAGFDGLHYEWFGRNPSAEFVAAVKAVRIPVAMFYDLEIRHQSAQGFVKPTDAFVKSVVDDVGGFYDTIPRELWLRQADGTLPVILYAYQFDQSYTGVDVWDRFYRSLLQRLDSRLGVPVTLYWTDAGPLCQLYAFQHFPRIRSYSFSWWGGQRQANARAVTLVAHYDDRGACVGGRATRTAQFDPRFLEEDMALARLTRPDMVFHYGWNEFYEGENVMPDRTWGDWRLQAVGSVVRKLRADEAAPGQPLPSALILADDLYREQCAKPDPFWDSENVALGAYRYLLPQADTLLPAQVTPARLGRYKVIVALARNRSAALDRALMDLAASGRARVVFFSHGAAPGSPVAARFLRGTPARPFAAQGAPPSNQYNSATRDIDVDVRRFPVFRIRVRSTPGCFYHVRFTGVDAEGRTYDTHDNQSPLDWKATGGGWADRKENALSIAEAFAGKPIVRVTRLWLYLNAQGARGDFAVDYADAAFEDETGKVGLSLPMQSPAGWRYYGSFVNAGPSDPLWPRGSLQSTPDGRGLRLALAARFAADVPYDATTLDGALQPGVRVLASFTRQGRRIPLVLRRSRLFLVNTASPWLGAYQALWPALDMPEPREAEHILFTVVGGRAAQQKPTTPCVLPRDELPLDTVRMHHPADIATPVTYPLPASSTPLAATLTRGGKARPEALKQACTSAGVTGIVTLRPGDTLDLVRVPVSVTPREGRAAVVTARLDGPGAATLMLPRPAGTVVRPLRPGVRVALDPNVGAGRLTLHVTWKR